MGSEKKSTDYLFTFGPWNISMGADPFGPPVRKELAFASKVREYKKLGFDGVQLHDDDVVEADLDPQSTERGAAKVKKMLDGEGLFCEFIAPRLWEHPKTIDGGYTSNSASERKYAIERSKRAIDIANAMGTKDIVLWLAREGTYIREAKDPIGAVQRILDAVNASVDLRRAFNTVWVLERSSFDGCVGLDVKAMRTTKAADQTKHLANSKEMFLRLLDVVRSVDTTKIESYRAERDYEGLELYILK